MEYLTSWKKRKDKHQESDNVKGMGDQVEGFSNMESPGLCGSPSKVSFIGKDETNAEAMKDLRILKKFDKWQLKSKW